MGKIYLNGVDYSAPSQSGVSGVKGNAETTYRQGQVNLTPENLGAATAQSVTNIVNGTTKVGNADKLDGNDSSYFAKSADLAKYLPKDGSVPVDRLFTIGATSTDKYVALLLNNLNRSLEFGITQGGVIQLHDATNKKNVFTSALDGTNTFNGTLTTKPTGTYTGNGSATSRTIATNGIGNALAIYGNGMAIVTISGAICKVGASVVVLESSQMKFANGELIIATDEYFNKNGSTYSYQVL